MEEAQPMSDALQNLIEAIAEWRETRSAPTVEPIARNPYGAKIYALNMDWARTKDEHARLLDEKRAKYQEQVDKLHELAARWKADNPQKAAKDTGRRRLEHPDEIKTWAAQALREGVSKSTIRALLGIADTERLNTLLAEGEALLKAREG